MTPKQEDIIEKRPDLNRLIKLVAELVYYSQIHTVKGVRPANMQVHEQSWREAQQWLWDNCEAKEGEYFLRSVGIESEKAKDERIKELTGGIISIHNNLVLGNKEAANDIAIKLLNNNP